MAPLCLQYTNSRAPTPRTKREKLAVGFSRCKSPSERSGFECSCFQRCAPPLLVFEITWEDLAVTGRCCAAEFVTLTLKAFQLHAFLYFLLFCRHKVSLQCENCQVPFVAKLRNAIATLKASANISSRNTKAISACLHNSLGTIIGF